MSQRNKDNYVCAFVSSFITEYLWDAEIKVHTKSLHLVLLFLISLSSCVLAHRKMCYENSRNGKELEEMGFQCLCIGKSSNVYLIFLPVP